MGGIVIDSLQPAPRGNRSRSGARPRHAVAHNRGSVAISVKVGIHTPVLAAHRAVDAGHPRQADVHQLCRIIIFHCIVNIMEKGVRRRPVLIFPATLQVDVHPGAPWVFLHDPHQLREEFILRPVCVIPQRSKNGCRAVVHHGQHPLDVRPFVDIRHHGGNARSRFGNCACCIHLKCKNAHGIKTVTVITERLVHPAVPHERPHHAPLALQIIPQTASPPSCISWNSK